VDLNALVSLAGSRAKPFATPERVAAVDEVLAPATA